MTTNLNAEDYVLVNPILETLSNIAMFYNAYYSGRRAPSLKMHSFFLFFLFFEEVEFLRLRSTALNTLLFCTHKMADACLVCLY